MDGALVLNTSIKVQTETQSQVLDTLLESFDLGNGIGLNSIQTMLPANNSSFNNTPSTYVLGAVNVGLYIHARGTFTLHLQNTTSIDIICNRLSIIVSPFTSVSIINKDLSNSLYLEAIWS